MDKVPLGKYTTLRHRETSERNKIIIKKKIASVGGEL
jgi:hypothetical protein